VGAACHVHSRLGRLVGHAPGLGQRRPATLSGPWACEAVAYRPPRRKGRSHGPDSAHARFTPFPFSFLFKQFQKWFKLPKFVETCRNVQKLQNKFCMNPLEPLFTVGLAKFTFEYHFIVQNFKNSDNKIIVYKYICLKIIWNFACVFISSPVAHTKSFVINSFLE
jgi:hypothetical protein